MVNKKILLLGYIGDDLILWEEKKQVIGGSSYNSLFKYYKGQKYSCDSYFLINKNLIKFIKDINNNLIKSLIL